MKIVVIGGSGLIGSKLVNKLQEHGHAAVPASPDSGVNTLTGEGLAEALEGAAVVVDVSNSPSFEDAEVRTFSRHQPAISGSELNPHLRAALERWRATRERRATSAEISPTSPARRSGPARRLTRPASPR
jgi:uncharacterized protein YbjT (DUF2867 family)